MKKIISFILVLFLLPMTLCYAEDTNCFDDKYETAEKLLDILISICPNEYTAYGVLGMAYRESKFQSDAFGGWHLVLSPTKLLANETREEMFCRKLKEYTAKYDEGLEDGSTRKQFVRWTNEQTGGYGLFQLSYSYTEPYYDFASEHTDTLSDAETQCRFVVEYMKENCSIGWELLEKCESAYEAGCIMGRWFDGTASYQYIGEFSQSFYDYFNETK